MKILFMKILYYIGIKLTGLCTSWPYLGVSQGIGSTTCMHIIDGYIDTVVWDHFLIHHIHLFYLTYWSRRRYIIVLTITVFIARTGTALWSVVSCLQQFAFYHFSDLLFMKPRMRFSEDLAILADLATIKYINIDH